MGYKSSRVRGGYIHVNSSYTVTGVSDQEVVVTSVVTDTTRTLTHAQSRTLLKRPWCRTGHSTQGLSLGDKIYIHNWRCARVSSRWLRTVVSRCGTLDIVLVDGGARANIDAGAIARHIPSHMASDLARGFLWDDADYVSPAWVLERLHVQGWRCQGCSEALDHVHGASIDRMANDMPHLALCCQIVCTSCQSASAHRA
jgi:hypothetical protein